MKISVITVTYNARRWLERTLKSVIAQATDAVELLIIDGGSTDGTLELIGKYEDKIDYWISEPDKGLYDAMNKGLRQATGDYVWFINAGDTIAASTTVRLLLDQLKGKELPDVIYGETGICDESGRSIGTRRLKAPEQLNWKSFKWGMLVCHQSFLAKRAGVPLYDLQYKLAADYDWCIRCLKQAKSVHNSHLVLSEFLEGGVSSLRRREGLKERYRIMCRYYGKGSTLCRHVWFALRFYFAKWFIGRV